MTLYQTPGQYLNFIGFLFESAIIGVGVILLILILIRFMEKKHRLTLLLFLIFLNYLIAIIFSWVSKIFVAFDLLGSITPESLEGIFIFRIKDFRISEFFVAIALFISYILKVNVFEDEYDPILKIIVAIYGGFTAFYVLVIYVEGNVLLDAIAFLLVFIFMSIIYIPFMIRSIKTYNSVEDRSIKRAFLSLALMSLSFMLIFLNFFIDRIFILTGSLGFTLFYFLAWIFAIIGMTCAYLGYIRRPK
ncbi:MAG: hypothetical protein EU550_03545 [Promethearchaeota archaeon]|nr:MAG: hypothetical protein EU550_03545 [Candidatus Lokiarchaeota archaeon]